MGKPSPAQRREDRERAKRVTEQLANLGSMTTAQLAARLEELSGRPSRTRNRQYLRKRVAWHLQAAEYGGLSKAALATIDELAPLAMKLFDPATRRGRRSAKITEGRANARDPRLPKPGSILTRAHGGEVHEVTVLEAGFEYRGSHYGSLSKVAREITGSQWNGFTFFGCRSPTARAGGVAA